MNLLTSIKNHLMTTKTGHPMKADYFLIDFSPQKGLKKFGKRGRMLMSGLLFFKKFRKSTEKNGCKVNLCNPCVDDKDRQWQAAHNVMTRRRHEVWSGHMDPKVNGDLKVSGLAPR